MPYGRDPDPARSALAEGHPRYFKATNLARLDDELIERLIELHLAAPGPQAEIHVHQLGGAIARVPRPTPRSPTVDAPTCSTPSPAGTTPSGRGPHRLGATVIEAAAAASTGHAYVNFLGDAGAGRSSYGEATYARLVALKHDTTPRTCSRATTTSSLWPAPERRLGRDEGS